MSQLIRWRLIFPFPDGSIKLFNRDEIIVKYNTGYARSTFPEFSERIDESWKKAIERARVRNCNLPVDKSKFRLAGIDLTSNGVELKIGPARYKEHVALRTNPHLLRWTRNKAEKLGIDLGSVLPNIIDTVTLVITKDSESFGFIRRKGIHNGYVRYLDLPGGYPELSYIEDYQNFEKYNEFEIEKKICDELYNSFLREIKICFGITLSSIRKPIKFIGILQDLNNVRKPELVFIVHTKLSINDIHDHFVSLNRKSKDFIIFNPIDIGSEVRLYQKTSMMEAAFALIKMAKLKNKIY